MNKLRHEEFNNIFFPYLRLLIATEVLYLIYIGNLAKSRISKKIERLIETFLIILLAIFTVKNERDIFTRIRKQFTKEIKKPKPSMMTIPFISVYKLTSRTPRSFSKIKLFAQHISLLTFLVFVIAEEVNIKLNNAN